MNGPEAQQNTSPASEIPDSTHRARARYSRTEHAASESAGAERETAVKSGIERTFAESEALDKKLGEAAQYWRDEVSTRVDSYRTRRSRKRLAGEYTMRLDFDRAASRAAAAAAEPVMEPPPVVEAPAEEVAPAAAPAVEVDPAFSLQASATADDFVPQLPPLPGEAAALRQRSKVLEFPHTLIFPEFGDDPNAPFEPVLDKPRILDVPEAVPAAVPPLADIALQGESEEEPAPRPVFDLPLRVASLPLRFTAALIDWVIVLVGVAMFVMIVARVGGTLPHTRPALALALAVPLIFWGMYNYLFLTYAGTTPGMQLAHLCLSDFEGETPPRAARRWRALLMVLSCVSLGFGFLWALFDEDELCWHDRMTRTYLTMWS